MIWSSLRLCTVLELLVMVFQVTGVGALCLHRLTAVGPWRDRGRIGFIIALVGLGIAGALCGRHDSEFALFAGGTMTLLLIGMTMGSGHADATVATRTLGGAEPTLAG